MFTILPNDYFLLLSLMSVAKVDLHFGAEIFDKNFLESWKKIFANCHWSKSFLFLFLSTSDKNQNQNSYFFYI